MDIKTNHRKKSKKSLTYGRGRAEEAKLFESTFELDYVL